MSMNTLGVGLEGLGIDVENTVVSDAAPAEPEYKSTLVKGSVLAKALFEFYSCTPVIIVPAPPGGGKSTLIAELVYQIYTRENYDIVVAVPTKNAGAELSKKIHEVIGGIVNADTGETESAVKWGISSESLRPEELTKTVSRHRITVRTVASCVSSPPECDLMLIDEAWQTITADVVPAADRAKQLVLVGDSGQIGPVITIDVSQFKGDFAPHLQAPVSFATLEGSKTLPITNTYRLGSETVSVIQPMYDFEFTSLRPDRHLVHSTSGRLPEIEAVEFGQVETPDDKVMLNSVLSRAISFIGSTVQQGEDSTVLTDGDVAIVVAHNSQSAPLAAMAQAKGYPNMLIGTADKLQGTQRHAVVALDPLSGQAEASGHHVSSGRACVMASRHMTHLTWMYPDNWLELLANSELEDAPVGIDFRSRLTSVSDSHEA